MSLTNQDPICVIGCGRVLVHIEQVVGGIGVEVRVRTGLCADRSTCCGERGGEPSFTVERVQNGLQVGLGRVVPCPGCCTDLGLGVGTHEAGAFRATTGGRQLGYLCVVRCQHGIGDTTCLDPQGVGVGLDGAVVHVYGESCAATHSVPEGALRQM